MKNPLEVECDCADNRFNLKFKEIEANGEIGRDTTDACCVIKDEIFYVDCGRAIEFIDLCAKIGIEKCKVSEQNKQKHQETEEKQKTQRARSETVTANFAAQKYLQSLMSPGKNGK